MSHVPPLIDPKHLALVTTAVLYVWPAVLVGIVALVRWSRLTQRPAFLVLGYLTCMGVEFFASSIGWDYSRTRYLGPVSHDQILLAFIKTSLTVTAVSIVVSSFLVLWLARTCERPPPQSPNKRLERP